MNCIEIRNSSLWNNISNVCVMMYTLAGSVYQFTHFQPNDCNSSGKFSVKYIVKY